MPGRLKQTVMIRPLKRQTKQVNTPVEGNAMNLFQQLRQSLIHSPEKRTEKYASQMMASLLTMAWFVEARDPYTGGHLWRVSRYARLLAEKAGENAAETAMISLGGFLHDLGKIAIPDSILRKTGPLTDEEYDIIKTHPDLGYRMLAGHPMARLVKDAIVAHHERPDGRGYPKKLAQEEIPKVAKIVGICDAFDAMTSHRPYRAGMPKEKALSIIRENMDSQFDIYYADLFLQLGEEGVLDHIIAHSDEGIPLRDCPMCGPTLVIRREHQENDHIYCRNCTGEFVLKLQDGLLQPEPTGGQGQASDLEPELDTGLIAATVQQSVADLPVELFTRYIDHGDSSIPIP
ncbi:HD-GYP domain-containing protein [Vibrio quintilis]|uniref:Cyclic di-GMP phosphodiesterase response regulator RpfG n=1 Tax=Vibrio quintilis TaxID=1117707 RepID=A0A1M7YY25_9VIBR|nr:HD-GYP domain-containing protein [Vibrio quintilis]SHO57376.1 Cyclic di-GMP phosphodiesterase response regulator RpfG [Vibrio quintilis]